MAADVDRSLELPDAESTARNSWEYAMSSGVLIFELDDLNRSLIEFMVKYFNLDPAMSEEIAGRSFAEVMNLHINLN